MKKLLVAFMALLFVVSMHAADRANKGHRRAGSKGPKKLSLLVELAVSRDQDDTGAQFPEQGVEGQESLASGDKSTHKKGEFGGGITRIPKT